MKHTDYWNIFELTGSVSDYLNYACTSEERQEMKQKEGGQADESGDSDGDGFISYARWRV